MVKTMMIKILVVAVVVKVVRWHDDGNNHQNTS